MTYLSALAGRMLACVLAGAVAVGLENRSWGADAAAPAAGDAVKTDGAPRQHRQGQLISVPLPLNNNSVVRAMQSMQRAMGAVHDERPIFILEFVSPEGDPAAAQGTQFEDAHKLARFLTSEKLNGANTVAYIPHAVRGHAVLAVIACEQIIMAPDATLGDAGADEKTIGNTLVAAYTEIAGSRQTVPVAVALGLLDKSRKVIKAQIEDQVRFITADEEPALAKAHRILSQQVIKQPGEPWQIKGTEGRDWGIVKLLAADRNDLVRQLELSSEVVAGDPSQGLPWKPIEVEIKGPITAQHVETAIRQIDEQKGAGKNFICIWIDSPGGAPMESKRLADYLATLPANEVRTVAYIDNEARADAALVALGCDEIVMLHRAILGGPGRYQMRTQEEVLRYQGLIRDSLARRKLRSWSLWAAMFNPRLPVYQCERLGDKQYFCDEELHARQPLRDKGEQGALWQKGEQVTTPGQVLTLTGDQAFEYGVATSVVDNFAQFKQNYSMEKDPTLVEPGWVEALAHFLNQQAMFGVLLFLGGLGIYIELHAPGTGIGAFLAVVAFALFFWSRFLEGNATWLEVTLFATGCLCLLTELFVLPGFLIFGVGGGALILTSIVLASQTFFLPQNEYQLGQLQNSLYALTFSVCGLVVAIWALNHWLPHAPGLQQVFLAPPEGEEAETIRRREMLVDLDNLAGQTGVTTTPLGPSGKARFGNHLVDVISTGEFILRDTQVVVTEVHGNRVVVRAASGGNAQA